MKTLNISRHRRDLSYPSRVVRFLPTTFRTLVHRLFVFEAALGAAPIHREDAPWPFHCPISSMSVTVLKSSLNLALVLLGWGLPASVVPIALVPAGFHDPACGVGDVVPGRLSCWFAGAVIAALIIGGAPTSGRLGPLPRGRRLAAPLFLHPAYGREYVLSRNVYALSRLVKLHYVCPFAPVECDYFALLPVIHTPLGVFFWRA